METTLLNLGFVHYRDINLEVAETFWARTGVAVPTSYLTFLCHRQPSEMQFSYRFEKEGQTWQGCVAEFDNIAPQTDDLANLAEQVVQTPTNKLLVIGSDPGGNWLGLDLLSGAVYDLDYASGAKSVIATSFEDFVEMLQVSEEY
jgi:hypothetical protein